MFKRLFHRSSKLLTTTLSLQMASSKPNFLFVLTSHSEMGTSGKSTGWYLPEFAFPYVALSKVADITVVSPAGGAAPVDQGSVDNWKKNEVCNDFWENKSALWKNTETLSSYLGKSKDFAGIFYVGGHGPMYDLAIDSNSIQLIKEFWENDKIVSAICHGSAALVNVKLSDGSYLVADSEVTGFSNDEEDAIKLSEFMPFMLETELQKNSNGKYVKAEKTWGDCVVASKGGRLITGQNPFSAETMGKKLVEAVSK